MWTAALAVAVIVDVEVAYWVHVVRPLRCVAPLGQVLWWFGHFTMTLAIGSVLAVAHPGKWRSGLFAVASGVLAGLCYSLAKWSVGRTRPFKGVGAFDIDPFTGGWNALVNGRHNEAFPSGHTCLAFAVAFALARLLPRWRWAFFVVAGMVGMSRVLVGAHYPSDVVAGAGLGVLAAYVVSRWLEETPCSKTAESDSKVS
jgi:membrane-associated phospholipid phosphatase